ncbi:MAG: hypothetical protein WBP26_03530 [Candidatus Saccharimonadales bacterium]
MTKHDPLQGILQLSPKRLFFLSKSGTKLIRSKRTNDPIQGVLFSTGESPTTTHCSAHEYRDSIYEGVRRGFVTSLDSFTLAELSEITKSNNTFSKRTRQSRSDFIDMCIYMHHAMNNLKNLKP